MTSRRTLVSHKAQQFLYVPLGLFLLGVASAVAGNLPAQSVGGVSQKQTPGSPNASAVPKVTPASRIDRGLKGQKAGLDDAAYINIRVIQLCAQISQQVAECAASIDSTGSAISQEGTQPARSEAKSSADKGRGNEWDGVHIFVCVVCFALGLIAAVVIYQL